MLSSSSSSSGHRDASSSSSSSSNNSSKQATISRTGSMLLSGWKMLSQHCPICMSPLLSKGTAGTDNDAIRCPGCDLPVVKEYNHSNDNYTNAYPPPPSSSLPPSSSSYATQVPLSLPLSLLSPLSLPLSLSSSSSSSSLLSLPSLLLQEGS